MDTAQRRRWAQDMREAWADTRNAGLAAAHADRMIAIADMEDAEAGVVASVAEVAVMEYDYPIIGHTVISRGGRARQIEHAYSDSMAAYCEAMGIYTAWEWRYGPESEERTGSLSRLYIGSREHGPEAMYDAEEMVWQRLLGRGNHGRRYACGGTWSGQTCSGDDVPEIYIRLQEIIMERDQRIAEARRRLEAANKRVMAAHQRDRAAAYMRQASNPAYDGQAEICIGQADIMQAIAARTDAEADLIEA